MANGEQGDAIRSAPHLDESMTSSVTSETDYLSPKDGDIATPFSPRWIKKLLKGSSKEHGNLTTGHPSAVVPKVDIAAMHGHLNRKDSMQLESPISERFSEASSSTRSHASTFRRWSYAMGRSRSKSYEWPDTARSIENGVPEGTIPPSHSFPLSSRPGPMKGHSRSFSDPMNPALPHWLEGPESIEDFVECTEPTMRYLHVRILEARVPDGLKDASEGVFIKAILGTMKLSTKVIPKTAHPKWNQEMILGCLKPMPNQSLKSLIPEFLEIALKQFYMVKSNAAISRFRVPLDDIPAVDTSVSPEPEPIWLPDSGSQQGPAVRAALWFETAYDTPRLKPVVGQVSVVVDSATIFPLSSRFKRSRGPYAVLQYGQQWVKLPPSSHSTSLSSEHSHTFDISEPSALLTVAIFESGSDTYYGMVRIHASVLPHGEWLTFEQPLYVRKESRHSPTSTVQETGRLVLKLRLSYDSTWRWFGSFFQPIEPSKFSSATFQKYKASLVKHHNYLVRKYLKQHPISLPRTAALTVLNTRLEVFSLAESKVQLNRFMDCWEKLEWMAHQMDDVCKWKQPLVSLAINVAYVLLVYQPLKMIALLFTLQSMFLVHGALRRSEILADYVAMDPLLFVKEDEDEKKGKGLAPVSPESTGSGQDDDEDDSFEGLPRAKLSRNPAVIFNDKLSTFFFGGLKVQRMFDRMATWMEWWPAMLHWHEPTISSILLMVSMMMPIVLVKFPSTLQPLLTLIGLYLLRHPRFRDDEPTPLSSCIRRLPNRNERIIPSSEDYSDRSVAGNT